MQQDTLEVSSENETKKSQSNSKMHLWVAFLALLSMILAIATAGAAFYMFKNDIEPQQAILEQQLIDLQDMMSETQGLVSSQQKLVNIMQKDLNRYEREEKTGGEYLSEAEYLVKLAMFNLAFNGNVVTARQLLQTADERVRSVGDTLSWPIRGVLAKDIAALDAVPKVDVAGMVARLKALSQQVESLKRPSEPLENTAMTGASEEQNAKVSIKEKFAKAGHRFLDILSKLITISYDVPKAAPLLPPDQYAYVIANIQAELAMAEWAVLYRDPDIYTQSLAQAKIWARRYFVNNDSHTEAFLNSINELEAIPVKPDFPDLYDSLRAIEEARKGT